MARYLIFRLGAFGDLSFVLPAVEQLHQKDPAAHVTWVIGRTYVDLLSSYPQVHRWVLVDEQAFFHGFWWARLRECFRLGMQFKGPYDQIWIGHRSVLFLLFIRLFTRRSRYFQMVRAHSWMNSFMRDEVLVPPRMIQESLAWKKVVEAAFEVEVPLCNWKADLSWVPLFSFPNPWVIVHLGGGVNIKTEFRLKRWPYWEEFLTHYLRVSPYVIFLVGAQHEASDVEALLHAHPEWESRIISKVGKTSGLTLLSLLKGAKQVIGVDSGPLHWADLAGVPCIGLYGPTSAVSWGLLGTKSIALRQGLSCSPCYGDDGEFPECTHQHQCMKQLTSERVMQHVVQQLEVGLS